METTPEDRILRCVKPGHVGETFVFLCCPHAEDQPNSVSYIRAESPADAAREWCLNNPTDALEPRLLYVRLGLKSGRRVFKVCTNPQIEEL